MGLGFTGGLTLAPMCGSRSWYLGVDTAERRGLRVRKRGHTWKHGLSCSHGKHHRGCELESLDILVISSSALVGELSLHELNQALTSKPRIHTHG